MNILFITNKLPPAIDGVGDYTFNLAREFALHGNEVSIICHITQSPPPLSAHIEIYPCIERWDSSSIPVIAQIINAKRCDIVSLQYVPHGFHPKGLPFGLIDIARSIKRQGVPLFTFAHEIYARAKVWQVRRYIASVLMQWISRQIIEQSQYIATSIPHYRDMIEGLLSSPRGVEVISIASNVPYKEIAVNALREIRSTIATKDQLIISFFGYRDINSSIKAIERLRLRGVKIKLLLIGKLHPNTLAPIDTYTTGKLKIEELDKYLQLSDILILPEESSQGVSFKSGSLAAALQRGLPVITSSGLMTDRQLLDGENIIFTDFASIDSIAKSIERLTNRALRNKVSRGAKIIASTISWRATYNRYIEMILPPPPPSKKQPNR